MKTIAGILTVAITMLLSCTVIGEPYEDEGDMRLVDGTLTGTIVGEHAYWDNVSVLFFDTDTWAVTVPVKNEKFTLTLPKPGTAHMTYLEDTMGDEELKYLKISVKNVRVAQVGLYVRKGSQQAWLWAEGSSSKGNYEVEDFIYVDKDVDITGSYTYEDSEKYIWDLKLKKGWNAIILYNKKTASGDTVTVLAGTVPAGAVWRAYE